MFRAILDWKLRDKKKQLSKTGDLTRKTINMSYTQKQKQSIEQAVYVKNQFLYCKKSVYNRMEN